MVIPINVGERIEKVVSAALLLHLIGFDGILLSAKRGESNRGGGRGEDFLFLFITCTTFAANA